MKFVIRQHEYNFDSFMADAFEVRVGADGKPVIVVKATGAVYVDAASSASAEAGALRSLLRPSSFGCATLSL